MVGGGLFRGGRGRETGRNRNSNQSEICLYFNRIQPYARDLILPVFVKALDAFLDMDQRSFEVDGAIEGSIAPQDISVIESQSE